MLSIVLGTFQDPLKKREQFSVSLRKQRKLEIIASKRKRAHTESTPDRGEEEGEMDSHDKAVD